MVLILSTLFPSAVLNIGKTVPDTVPVPIVIPLTVKSYAPRFTALLAPIKGTKVVVAVVQVKVPEPLLVNNCPFVPRVFG